MYKKHMSSFCVNNSFEARQKIVMELILVYLSLIHIKHKPEETILIKVNM